MKAWHLFLLILMNCCWAASYSAFKALAPWLDAGGVAALRFAMAGAVLLLCWPWLPGLAPRGRELVRTVVMGILAFGCSPRLQVAGVQLGSATDASVLIALEPLIVSVGATLFLREGIGGRRWLGFGLGLTGVVLMSEVWRPGFRWPALTANVLILLSLFCDAASSILGKPIVQRAGVFKVLAIAVVAGAAVNALADGPSLLSTAARLPVRAWCLLAYLALFCTVAGYALWFAVIRETKINAAALTIFLQPVVGTLVAMIWLGESLHWGQLLGSLVIGVGLTIGLWRRGQRPTLQGEVN